MRVVTRFTVNRTRGWADDLRVAVPNLMRLMSAHRADHPSTLPRLLLALVPVVTVPALALALGVGMLTAESPEPAAARTVAQTTTPQPAGQPAQQRDDEVSRSAHRYPQRVLAAAAQQDPLIATSHLRSQRVAAHAAKVERAKQRRLARLRAERQAREQARRAAERRAAREAARKARRKAEARQARTERREAKALAAAQAAADAAATDALTSVEPGTLRAAVLAEMLDYGFAADQWPALDRLIMRESSWNPQAQNASSGAYGLPQSLPGSKMAAAGADWRTNPITQVRWMFAYISSRYGNPDGAWAHSEAVGWY